MYEKLRTKVLSLSESHADLIMKQIQASAKCDSISDDEYQNILEGIRILHHTVVMLTKIDRLCNGINTGGQEAL